MVRRQTARVIPLLRPFFYAAAVGMHRIRSNCLMKSSQYWRSEASSKIRSVSPATRLHSSAIILATWRMSRRTNRCEQSVQHLMHVYGVCPEVIAHDLHPDYFSTQYVRRSTLSARRVAVQHHHAHIASCMADNGLDDRQLIGLSFDNTGYGTDGALWGGEVLLASYSDFERFAHLEYLPLPGGETASRAPWRIATAYAHALGLEINELPFLQNVDMHALQSLRRQMDKCGGDASHLLHGESFRCGSRHDRHSQRDQL